jgi:hypothetical protein
MQPSGITKHVEQDSDDTRCCKIQFLPPEYEHIIARNMSRYLM